MAGPGPYKESSETFDHRCQAGYNDSTKKLNAFKGGFAEKGDLAATLRAHQVAVDEIKSPQTQRQRKELRKPKNASYHASVNR